MKMYKVNYVDLPNKLTIDSVLRFVDRIIDDERNFDITVSNIKDYIDEYKRFSGIDLYLVESMIKRINVYDNDKLFDLKYICHDFVLNGNKLLESLVDTYTYRKYVIKNLDRIKESNNNEFIELLQLINERRILNVIDDYWSLYENLEKLINSYKLILTYIDNKVPTIINDTYSLNLCNKNINKSKFVITISFIIYIFTLITIYIGFGHTLKFYLYSIIPSIILFIITNYNIGRVSTHNSYKKLLEINE